MFRWFKRKPVKNARYSVFSLLNSELERLHDLGRNGCADNSEAQKEIYRKIFHIQDQVLLALAKQPTHQEEIRDLQESVADILLLGNGDE